ncbi:hypothetical protein M3Y94_00138600 [Aphelenchoides besseyi]|nr:hypothetical protein M3Y94_00138600 [Aphelenchoides besseyi]
MRRFTRSLSGGVSNCSREFLFRRTAHLSPSLASDGLLKQNSEDTAEFVESSGSQMNSDRCIFLGFVGQSTSRDSSAGDFKREDASLDHALIDCNRIRSLPSFREAILLRCIEPQAMFPFLHFSIFSPNAFDNNPTLSSSFETNKQSSFGAYEELYYIQKSSSFIDVSLPSHRHSGFIISSFKILDSNGRSPQLEKSWLVWTGAREIYKFAPRIWNLRRMSLLRIRNSYAKDQSHSFAYVLCCEFGNLMHPNNIVQALDMCERLRARNCGQIGLYQIQYNYGASTTIPIPRAAESRLNIPRTSATTIWPTTVPHDVMPRASSAVQRFGSSPIRQKITKGHSQEVETSDQNNTIERRAVLNRMSRDRSLGYQSSTTTPFFRSYQQFEEFT